MGALEGWTPVRWLKVALLAVLVAVWWRAGFGGHGPGPGDNGVGFAIFWTVATALVLLVLSRPRRRGRARHIDTALFPRHLRADVRQRYPQLTDAQLADVERGLRQFFHCHLRARHFVSMPSQAVDALWHAFILDTRAYQRFCRDAFGGFLHHSPAQTLGLDARRNDGLRRTWFHACRLEGIDPRAPASLPLLFALDAALAIPGGFRYLPDCRQIDRVAGTGEHCGTAFGDHSVSGDADGFGGEAGGSDGAGGGDGGGDGGGCGGGD